MRSVGTSPLLSRLRELGDSDSVALVDALGCVSFAEIGSAASRLASELKRTGAGGRRVALALPRSRHWLIGFWGTLLAGSTAVPLHESQPAAERQRLLKQAGAVALLSQEGSTNHADLPAWPLGENGALPESAQVASGIQHLPATDRETLEPALLLFTSGTTGRPKGVPLSHETALSGMQTLIDAWQLSASDRLVHVLPLHHLHGICVALGATFLAGGTTELLPRFEASRVLEACERATLLMGVPTQHQRLIEHLDECEPKRRAAHARTLASLRLITSGSAKLPERLGRRLRSLTGKYPLERYGMTEVGIVLSNPLSGLRKPGWCGKPLPGCDVRIMREDGSEAEPGESGEIWIRGASVFSGYDGDEAATARAFENGYFKSGDTATRDAEGFVQILGRTSVDILDSGGYKLSAIEIEEALREHANVVDAAVVGVPDAQWGERVVAVVVAGEESPSEAAAAEDLRAFLRTRLSSYKLPKQFVFQTQLPRNSLGKVQKVRLKQWLAEQNANRT